MFRLNNKAFSLLELILSIFIVTILLYGIVPSTSLFTLYQEKVSIDEFIRDVQHYKNKAVIEMNTYNIKIYPFDGRYEVLGRTSKVIEKKSFNPRIRFGSNNFKNNTITFNPRGSSNSGSLVLKKSNGKSTRLSIEVGNSKINVREE